MLSDRCGAVGQFAPMKDSSRSSFFNFCSCTSFFGFNNLDLFVSPHYNDEVTQTDTRPFLKENSCAVLGWPGYITGLKRLFNAQ